MKKIVFVFLIAAIALTGCNMFGAKKDKKDPGVKKRAQPELRDENADVDFQAFVSRLKKAVAAHDASTVASMMTDEFAFVLGASRRRIAKEKGFLSIGMKTGYGLNWMES